MDRLLQDNPQLYEDYAIRDAEIGALHVDRLGAFVRDELGIPKMPITLGGISAEVLLKYWCDVGVSEEQINGYVRVKETHFNRAYTTLKSKRYLTKPGRRYNANYEIHRELAERCFHGGRNECYAYGPTSDMSPRSGAVYAESETDGPVLWREFDLKGAYATSLSALRIPDYDAAFVTKDPAAFRADMLGFARVRFSFPEDCRFPCLPVEAEHDRGLIYPRSGEAYVTGPEIELARHLGAKLEILNGVVVPWFSESQHPFREVIKDLRRRRGEHEKGTLQNELFKQLGNGIYGKLGQGIKGNTAYNTRTDSHEEIGESKITNPYLAAHVTGLIRALLGELIAAAGRLWTVISATTDSIITNCQFSMIELGGPIARYMIGVAEALEGKPDLGPGRGILEQKAEASRLLPWRTRGIATLACERNPKLAQAGMRAPQGLRGNAANAWFVRAMADRFPGMKYESSEPLSFPYAHRLSADHVYQTYQKSCNFEFDFKRRPVTPVPKFFLLPQLSEDEDQRIVQHLSFNTIPWQSVEEFNETRALFEAFRTKHRGQLKHLSDWERWETFQAGTRASLLGVKRSKDGPVGQALQLFRRAYVRAAWALPGGDYRRAAEALTAAGYPTKEQTFKDAKRADADLPEHAIPADAPGIPELVRAILSIWPEFEADRLVDGEVPGTCAFSAFCVVRSPREPSQINDL